MHRYGNILPDDDAGLDDLILAAHHIVFLRGEVIEHIVAWAHRWAPWLSPDKAEQLAEKIAANPRKWTADALAWRLRLTAAERAELSITTIGAFDQGKAEREKQRKERQREAARDRRRRKAAREGRILRARRGRPAKNKFVASREDSIAGDAFPPNGGAAREAAIEGTAEPLSTKQPPLPADQPIEAVIGESLDAGEPRHDLRADHPQGTIPSEPPPEIVADAIKLARDGCGHFGHWYFSEGEARMLLRRFWPGFVADAVRVQVKYGGRIERIVAGWPSAFKAALESESQARQRYRVRRRQWKESHKPDMAFSNPYGWCARREWERPRIGGGYCR